MRWLIEVTSIGKTDTNASVVDADTWQNALQGTREKRGESGPMSNFSIELLDSGYRAVDPMGRLIYVIKKAPDDGASPGSRPVGSSRPKAPDLSLDPPRVAALPKDLPADLAEVDVSDDAPTFVDSRAQPAPAAKAPLPAAGSLPAVAVHSPSTGPSSGAMKAAATTGDATSAAPHPESGPPPSSKSKIGVPPRPGPPSNAPAKVSPSTAPAGIPSPPRPLQVAPVHASDPVVAALTAPEFAAAAPLPASAVASDRTPVATQVIFKREQDPTASSPLTYREYVYAVAGGTTEAQAEGLLRAQFDLIQRSIEQARAGKLVNLAVFDVVFKGKPPVPPLATLAWKDWKGGAVVEFPRRRQSARPPAGPIVGGSQPPPPFSAVSASGQAFASAAGAEPTASPTSTSAPATSASAASAVAPLPPVAPASIAPAAPPSFPASTREVGSPVSHQASPVVLPAGGIPQAPLPADLIAQAPLPVAPAANPAAAAARPQSASPPSSDRMSRGSRPGPLRGRARGDELVTALFEAMHDLRFLRDALEGGDFCLSLALETLPSKGGVAHLYDIDHREFVVTCVHGKGTEGLLLKRHAESDSLLARAMRKRRAIVVANAATDEAASLERFAPFGGVLSIIVAPVMQAGRFLGAIEIVNPLDGAPFTEDEGAAVQYIAEQYAEFVAERGVVLDPERVRAAKTKTR